MRRLAPLLLALLAGACGDATPIPEHDAWIRITAEVEEVEQGRGFPLAVERVWSRDLEPEAWSDETLDPLVVRLEEVERRESDRHVLEIRRYRAHAFVLGHVAVPAPSFTARPRGGGPETVALGNRLVLRVRPTLDPAEPGPAELPGGLLTEPSPWLLPSAAAAVLLAGVAALLVRRRRRRRRGETIEIDETPDEAAEAPPGPHVRALERIERLRGFEPGSHEELQAYYLEASGLMRDYVGARFAVRTKERTSEEIVDALEDTHREVLAVYLRRCDAVKFARHRPAAAARGRLLTSATAFVRETANGEA